VFHFIYEGGLFYLSVSVNDLVKEEVNRQIDAAIEAIPHDTKSYGDPVRWSKLLFNNLNDFLLGYEVGYVVYAGMMYYKDQVIERGIKVDEEQDIR
jgi:hypothetical protein